MPKNIDPALRARSVRLVREHRSEYPSSAQANVAVARQEGVGTETLRRWVRQADIDAGEREGHTSNELAEIKRLKAENKRLREDVAILKAATVNSTGQRNSASSLSPGVSKFSVFLGREFSRAATLLRSSWVRPFILAPLGKY